MKKMEKIGLPVFCILVALVVLVNGVSAENMDISPNDQSIPYAGDFATYDVQIYNIYWTSEHTISATITKWDSGTDNDLEFNFTNSTGASSGWMESGGGWNWGTPACNEETIKMHVRAKSSAQPNNEYRFLVEDESAIGECAGGTVGGYTCGECRGKVTMLELKYTGDDAVIVEVFQKKNVVVFDRTVVQPGDTFSFWGADKKGTLGAEIAIKMNGEETKIHTSCSQPIGPGLVRGDFEVVAGTSKDGGWLCPVGPCMGCAKGVKPKVLTMQYTGENCTATNHTQDSGKVSCVDYCGALPDEVRIIATNKKNPYDRKAKVWFNGTVDINDEFDIDATNTGQTRLNANTYVYIFDGVNLLQKIKFHTSCSQPLNVGDQFGSLKLVVFVPK